MEKVQKQPGAPIKASRPSGFGIPRNTTNTPKNWAPPRSNKKTMPADILENVRASSLELNSDINSGKLTLKLKL